MINWFFYGSIIFFGSLFFLYFVYFAGTKKYLEMRSLSRRQRNLKVVYIALFAALSVTVLLILNSTLPLAVIPYVRVAFEGVLIKITGFVFGPIMGLLSALVTEIGTLMFIPSYFHYNYLIALMCFGFFAGLVKEFKTFFQNRYIHLSAIKLALIVFFSFSMLFILTNTSDKFIDFDVNLWSSVQSRFSSLSNVSPLRHFFFFVCLFSFLFIFACVIFFFIILKRKKSPFWVKNIDKINNLIPILMLNVYAEYLIAVFITTQANLTVFNEYSSSSFRLLFNGALSIAPFKIITNTAIIFTVWSVISYYSKGTKKESLI